MTPDRCSQQTNADQIKANLQRESRDNAFAAAELGDTALAAQAIQHDTDLLFSRKCRRVARRMSLTTCSAGSLAGLDFCLIFAPSKG